MHDDGSARTSAAKLTAKAEAERSTHSGATRGGVANGGAGAAGPGEADLSPAGLESASGRPAKAGAAAGYCPYLSSFTLLSVACAAASRATGTRNGEHDT